MAQPLITTSAKATTIAIAAITSSALPVFLVGSMGYQIRSDLSIEISQLGISIAIFFLVSACTSVIVGPFLDRRGAPMLIQISASLTALALIGIGLTTRTWLVLNMWIALAGAALAIASAAASLVLARYVRSGRWGLAFGLKQAAGPAATLLVGLSLPILGVTMGWRWSVVLGALVCVGVTAAAVSWKPVNENGDRFQTIHRERRGGATRSSLGALITIGTAFGLGNLASVALGAFLVTFAIDQGVTPTVAGLWLVVGSTAAICTRIFVGIQADRSPRRHLRTIALMMIFGSGGLFLMAIGPTQTLPPAVLVAFSAGWGWSGLLSMAVVLDNMTVPAFATAVTHTGGFLGSAVGPLAFGYMAAAAGYEVAWLSTAFAACLGGVLILFLDVFVVDAGAGAARKVPAEIAANSRPRPQDDSARFLK